MSAIEKYEAPQIADLDRWASKLYDSGMFSDAKSVAQAFVKIAAGAELGLTPFQSMTGVHIIQNKPVVGAGLLAAMLDRPPYNYTTEWEPSIEAPAACTITVFKNGVERGKARFSLDDAKRAGLLKGGSNWEKYPSDMLFARTVSQAARRYAAGAMGGTVYVEGELIEDSPMPAGVTPRERTRVTAEVVQPSEVEVETATTKSLLTGMSAFDKGELYRRCAIEKGARLADVKSSLCSAYVEWDWINVGEPCPDEPDPVAVLAEFRHLDRENRPGDGVEEFDRFAKTGEDLDAGDQATLDAEALA